MSSANVLSRGKRRGGAVGAPRFERDKYHYRRRSMDERLDAQTFALTREEVPRMRRDVMVKSIAAFGIVNET